jgi:hypothetical protein
LLEGRKFLWFARSIYQVRRRLRASVRSVLWEPIGAAMFAYMYLSQSLYRTCLNRLRIRPHAQ